MWRQCTCVGLILGAMNAQADGTAKVGTFSLANDLQTIGGEAVQFYDVPSRAVALSLDLGPRTTQSWRRPSWGMEILYVAYDVDAARSGTLDGQMQNSGLLLNATWGAMPRASLRPYLGFGGGLNYVDFDLRNSATSYQYQSELGLAGQAYAGVEWRSAKERVGLSAEVKYFTTTTYVDPSGAAAFVGFAMRLD